MIPFLISALLLSFSPDVRYSKDKRNYDGYHYTEYCVGLYQRPETWVCVEVRR